MGKNNYEPFSKETFEKLTNPWIEAIKNHECHSVLNLSKRDQLYHVAEFKKRYKKIHCIECDPISLDEASFQEKVHTYSNKISALFVYDADRLIREDENLLPLFEKLYHASQNISIIYLFHQNINYKETLNRISGYTTLIQNISVFPLFSSEDCQRFIQFRINTFKVSLKERIQKLILDECVGSYWLIKQAIRYLASGGSEKNLFTHDAFRLRLQILYDELLPRERKIVNSIVSGEMITRSTNEEKETLSYLQNTGLIKQEKQKYQITIPVLKKYIYEKNINRSEMRLEEGKIIKDNQIIDSLFSQLERKLLRLFLKNKHKIHSREEIGKHIWGDNGFSDWALDRIVSRLRRKLLKIGARKQTIITVRNQGYRLDRIT